MAVESLGATRGVHVTKKVHQYIWGFQSDLYIILYCIIFYRNVASSRSCLSNRNEASLTMKDKGPLGDQAVLPNPMLEILCRAKLKEAS